MYSVYLDKDGMMFGKRFDVDKVDNIIIDGVRYVSTPGLYELIFKRVPDDVICTEDDKQKYKSMLLTTNAHRSQITIMIRTIVYETTGDTSTNM